MGDYRMLAGLAVFITVIFAVLAAFGTESGDTSVRAVGPEWPPRFPSFDTLFPWETSEAPGCEIVSFCVNVLAYWLGAIGGVIVGGVVFIGGVLIELLELLFGIVTFHFEGLPPAVAWVNTAIQGAIIIVFALLVFRLIRSVIPFVSGSEG